MQVVLRVRVFLNCAAPVKTGKNPPDHLCLQAVCGCLYLECTCILMCFFASRVKGFPLVFLSVSRVFYNVHFGVLLYFVYAGYWFSL
jgi:hypothetical protein